MTDKEKTLKTAVNAVFRSAPRLSRICAGEDAPTSTRGLTPAEALALTVDSFRFMAAFEGAVPGASEVECGNYRDMDLPKAKAEAAAMLPVLEALTADQLHY